MEHLKTHREFNCEICQKEFPFESLLKEHMRTHSGESPYLCPQCGKTFKCGGNLRQHMERHSNVKRYACTSCPRRFKCRTDLTKHLATHQGAKNYTCDICGIRFARSYSLEQHKRLHVGNKIHHSCDFCEISICRACMCKKKGMFNTQEKHGESNVTIEEMLDKIMAPQLQQQQEFPLPQEICNSCMDQLEKAFKFQSVCLATNDRLYKTWSAAVVVSKVKENSVDTFVVQREEEADNNKEIEISGYIGDHQEEDLISYIETLEEENYSDNEEENLPLSSLRKLQKSINEKYNQIEGAIIKTFGRNNEEKECGPSSTLSEDKFQCSYCSKKFANENLLQKHRRSKHRVQLKKSAHENRLSQENISEDTTDIGGDNFDVSSRDLSQSDHEEKCPENDDDGKPKPLSHPCPQCKATFRFEKQMERHLKKHTDAHRFVCMVCHDRFKYPFMLMKHNEKHHPEDSKQHRNKTKQLDEKKEQLNKSFICNYCPAAYTNVGGLAQHMSKKHPEIVPYKCDKCDRTFVVEEHLKIHTNRHMGIKNFQCELCEKSFSFKFAMKQHMRIHTGDLNYLCTLCGKKFYRPSNLRQHMQRHGDDKPYSCPHCPKRFKCPSDRYIHLMSHQQGKNHVCSTCGARFSRVDTLHQHVKVLHSGEKPYKCDQCPMAFPRLMNLNRHRRTHTGEKPYKCKYCDKAYAQSNDLNKHLRTHLGENTYMCAQCPMAFKYQADLRNHEWEHYRQEKQGAAEQQSISNETTIDEINSTQTKTIS
ncbi:zinc finger protein 271-like [Musca vetustissima]|uniref:zinc finger protein 271-like n=1 Tax=Musca vetustissima TaxID=27455 RepID=UPI002AB64906|nr:zinc finger protein 271-like [Musca vetustissima]